MANMDLKMTFVNQSHTQFNRDLYKHLKGGVTVGVVQTPGPILYTPGGTNIQTYEINESGGGDLGSGNDGIYCTWTNGNMRFGTKIWAPVEIFSIGKRPYYYHLLDNTPGSSNLDWVKVKEDSEQYQWPTSCGFSIVATPQSNHKTMSLTIVISDLKS